MKTKCPRCPSSDAYHIYDYGKSTEHGHCFSCGYHQHPQDIERLKSQVEELNRANQNHIKDVLSSPLTLELPFGCTKSIPSQAMTWLDKYGIIREEIIDNDIQWCDPRKALIFPIRKPQMDQLGNAEVKSGPLLAYIARSFASEYNIVGDMYSHLRWTTKGPIQTTFHILGREDGDPRKTRVVIVEDIVSAIKVARITRCMPLFGANLSPKRLMWLHANTDNVIMWLDQNKWKEAVGFAKSLELVGLNTKVVYADKDPKAHSNDEIKQLISM